MKIKWLPRVFPAKICNINYKNLYPYDLLSMAIASLLK